MPGAPHPSAFGVHEAPTLKARPLPLRPGVAEPLVLVADDDDDARWMYCTTLALLGCRAVECRNGLEAVKAACLHRPKLVLMDVSMPVLDGLEATRRIKTNERTRGAFVVVITAFGDAAFSDAMNAGANAFLSKPFNPFLLREMLSLKEMLDVVQGDGGIVRTCACGKSYTLSQWKALQFCGTMYGAELRECVCGSSLALVVDARASA